MSKVEFTNSKLLFPSEEVEQLFLTYLAHWKSKNNTANINLCEEELKNFSEKCGEILIKYGSSSNYVEDIINLNREIASGIDNKTELEIKRNSISEELSRFISVLKNNIETLVAGEDLERDSSRAFNREIQITNLELENAKLIDLFPGSETIGIDDIKDGYPFNYIRQVYQKEDEPEYNNEIFNEEVKTIVEDTPKTKVVKIYEAPQELIDKIYQPSIEENSINDFYDAPTVVDSSFFDQDDDIVRSIEESGQSAVNDFAVEVTEETVEELPEDSIQPEELIQPERQNEETIEEVKTVQTTEPKVEENSEETIPFTCTAGISLKNIATAAYNDEELWNYIYENNKTIIDSNNKNNQSIEDLSEDKDILDGLVLNIPVSIPNKSQLTNETKKVA